MGRTSFTLDEIYDLTEGGLNVYENEIGQISFARNTRSPWRNDSSPSLQFFLTKDGRVLWKDWGENEVGNCFHFIMKIYQLNFYEAVQKIKEDLGLEEKRNFYEKKAKSDVFKPVRQKNIIIDFEDCPYSKKHAAYWNRYKLPVDFLQAKNTFCVRKWAINKKIQQISEGVLVFAYYAEDIDRVKILQIGKNVERKWVNNVPNNYLWDLPSEKVNELWIIKSRKDAFVLEYHFNKVCTALQSENAKTYLQYNADRTEKICTPDNIICCMGSDPQGKEQSKIITHHRGYRYFNTPNNFLRFDVEDPADVVDKFGISTLKRLLFKKGLLNTTHNL